MPCDLCAPRRNVPPEKIIIRVQTGFNRGVTCHSRQEAADYMRRLFLHDELNTAEIIISIIRPEVTNSILKSTV